MVAQHPRTALAILQTCWNRKKILFLCQCVGYRQNIRGLLKCKWEWIQGHNTNWPWGLLQEKNLGKISTLADKEPWRQSQRLEFDVVCGEKGHTNNGVHYGRFWANSGRQQRRRPLSERQITTVFIFAYMFCCVVASCLTEKRVAETCSW